MRYETQKWAKLLNSKLGKDWVTWSSETIFAEIRDELGRAPNDEDFQKVMAIRSYLNGHDQFFNYVLVFEKCILAINGLDMQMGDLQFCKPEEIAYGLEAFKALAPLKEFTLDVAEYIRVCCDMDGLVIYPPILKQFQKSELSAKPAKIEEKEDPTPMDIQQNKLYAIDEYIKMHRGDN